MIATKLKPIARNTPARRWTFEEMLTELPESNLPMELWDGNLIIPPAPSFSHQDASARFYKLLDTWAARHRLGKVGFAPLDMVLTSGRAVQPDVFFVSNARLSILQDRLRGAADLVAEVISPESRRRDRIDKRDLYEQHGVREYWLIDPEAQTVEVLYLTTGEYELVGRWHPGDEAKSRLLKGFTVPVSAVFSSE